MHNSEFSTCVQAIQSTTSSSWENWRRLSEACTEADVEAAFPELSHARGELRLGLGQRKVEFRIVETNGERKRAYFQGQRLLMLESEYPQLELSAEALLDALGAAEASLDFYQGTLSYEASAHVYSAQGLCVMTNPSKRNVLHVLHFPPTSLSRFQQELLPYTQQGHRIPQRH